MGNFKGNIGDYIKSETPEQRRKRCAKISVSMKGKKNRGRGGKDFHGIKVTIGQFRDGAYVKGSSRTILVARPPVNEDVLAEKLTQTIQAIRRNGDGAEVLARPTVFNA